MRLEVQRVPLSRVEGAAVLRLAGVIDTTTLSEFEQRLQETTGDGFDRLLLDLEKIRYINSSGFGALVKYSDHFRARGGGLVLIRIPAKVQVVLEMLGLQAFFPIYQTQAEAESALESGNAFRVAAAEAPPPAPRPSRPAPATRPTADPVRPPAAVAAPAAAPAEPAAPLGFPLTISCSVCSATLEVKASGSYRCPGCTSVFRASPECHVTFPETSADVSATHVAVDTGPTGRRAFKALVASLAEPLLLGRSSAPIGDAVDEICDWLQAGTGGQPFRFNALLVAGEKTLRVDIADSGPARGTDGLTRARALFETIDSKRISEGRNLTRLVLTRSRGSRERASLVETRS